MSSKSLWIATILSAAAGSCGEEACSFGRLTCWRQKSGDLVRSQTPKRVADLHAWPDLNSHRLEILVRHQPQRHHVDLLFSELGKKVEQAEPIKELLDFVERKTLRFASYFLRQLLLNAGEKSPERR